ncbi:hypothetical protein DXG01_004806 [Tephrocybe rancida]|nr:hypothetical protein DXG01_004806 [Tephrocybe rancida]
MGSMPTVLPTDASSPSIHRVPVRPVEWKHLALMLSFLGLKFYVFETLISAPSTILEPNTYQNWNSNDDFARAIVLIALKESEHDGLEEKKTAESVYRAVKN